MTKDISLKAACADSFYYPAEWDPSKGTLDSFQRKRGYEHHFGKSRTKNLHAGILVIRFEMPFTVQCLRCQTYIGQGTRYDADKKKVGKYFTTPIYTFSMRCGVIVAPDQSADGSAHCNQRFVIRTDPKGDDYELLEGLRKKIETWNPDDHETIALPDPETKRQMQQDPMFRVEKTARDLGKEKDAKHRLRDLHEFRLEFEDDYDLNCAARALHRKLRREEAAKAEEEARPKHFALPLLPEDAGDRREAKLAPIRNTDERVKVAARRAAIRAQPLLPQRGGTSKRAVASAAMAELAAKRRRVLEHQRVARLQSLRPQ